MKKMFLLITGSLFVCGCSYKMPDIPLIETFRKINSPNDNAQRWKDAEACGAKRLENDRISFEFDPPEKYMPKFYKFSECMSKKGYLYSSRWLE